MEIQKSPNDEREYKFVTLENSLNTLLISTKNCQKDLERLFNDGFTREVLNIINEDSSFRSGDEATADKLAAAAVCIGIGSYADPPQAQGLAHLVEHLLFMGTENFPEQNHFDDFLSDHEGCCNAVTTGERTVFYYEINKNYLRHSLEIFSEFFLCPLMNRSSIVKEIEAVESEFRLKVSLDLIRRDHVLATCAPVGHPIGKFCWGNKKTLGDWPIPILQNYLRYFISDYYNANNMTLVVMSPENIETLQEYVSDIFRRIPNSPTIKATESGLEEPFRNENFRCIYRLKTTTKTHQLSLLWSLPSQVSNYQTKPLHLLSWLVGNEEKGSLFSVLKSEKLAVKIYAGNEEGSFVHNQYHSLFSILVILTDLGMRRFQDVIDICFQYIRLLQTMESQDLEAIFKEIQEIEHKIFMWEQKESPSSFVYKLAESLMSFGPEHCLVGNTLFLHYDEDLIRSCLSRLVPENMCVILTSSNFQGCDKVEQWTRTQYDQRPIPTEWIAKWKSLTPLPIMKLPSPNPFITSNFRIKNPDSAVSQFPKIIVENEICRIWHKKDVSFKIPKAYICVHLISPICNSACHFVTIADLFVSLIYENLNEECYSANLAGLSFYVGSFKTGLIIKIYGFDEKIKYLCEKVFAAIGNLDLTDDATFENVKEQQFRNYHNKILNPANLSLELHKSAIDFNYVTISRRMEVLKSIKKIDVEYFVIFFRNSIFVEGLFQGNLTVKDSKEICDIILRTMDMRPFINAEFIGLRSSKLPENKYVCRVASLKSDDVNSVVNNFYQLGPYTLEKSCLLDLLLASMQDPAYMSLRVNQMLGYNVSCDDATFRKILGFTISVTSHRESCKKVDDCITEFLRSFLLDVSQELNNAAFREQVRNLIRIKGEPDNDLFQEVDRNFKEIINFSYMFDRTIREILCLNTLRFSSYRAWVVQHVVRCPVLSVQVVGALDEDINELNHHFQRHPDTNIPECKISPDGLQEFAPIHPTTLTYILEKDQFPIKNNFVSNIIKFRDQLEVYPASNPYNLKVFTPHN